MPAKFTFEKKCSALNSAQHGFTLVEVMIALALGLIIIGGACSYFLSTLTTSKTMLAQSKLQQNIRSTATLIQRDIRRAGYAPAGNSNAVAVSSIWIGKTLGTVVDDNCVIYRYVDERGNLRNSGFLLGADGQIYMKTAGTDNVCTTNTNWTQVTSSSNITVTKFSVTYAVGNRPSITLSINSQLNTDSAVKLPLNLLIVLQNAPSLQTAVTGS